MSTWYLMHRGWMDNPIIARYWTESYSRREAWIWMIENAAWEDHNTFSHGKKIEIKRGQIPTTVRKLMKEWRWSQGKVIRFISDLENDNMVIKNTDTGFYIITLCKYEEFQNPRNKSDTDMDTNPVQDSDTQTGANSNKGKNLNKENNNSPTPRKRGDSQPKLIKDLPIQQKEPCRFESEFWPLYPRKQGKDKAKEQYEKARLTDTQSNIIAGARALRRQVENDDNPDKMKYVKMPAGWLRDGRWKDFTESSDDEDDLDEMPKGMTPQQHAEWCFRRAGIT